MSVPTISEWLGILETTGAILLIPPFFENFGKHLIKSPKLYFTDSGLACHLLGLETESMLRRSHFLGPIFEGFVASEVAKLQAGAGRRREVYHFRDQQGLEVDFLVPLGGSRLALIEAKASATVHPRMGEALIRLGRAAIDHSVQCFVVHRKPGRGPGSRALREGVSAVTVGELPGLVGKEGRAQRAPRH